MRSPRWATAKLTRFPGSAGADVPAAADLAMGAAAVVVSKDGTATCSGAELRRSLSTHGKLVPDRDALAPFLDALRRAHPYEEPAFDLYERVGQ